MITETNNDIIVIDDNTRRLAHRNLWLDKIEGVWQVSEHRNGRNIVKARNLTLAEAEGIARMLGLQESLS
jgi:hypothetical protein